MSDSKHARKHVYLSQWWDFCLLEDLQLERVQRLVRAADDLHGRLAAPSPLTPPDFLPLAGLCLCGS